MTERPLFLYSGQCTGTMYLRRLLESNRGVDWCVLEDRRVDLERTPGYTINLPLHCKGAPSPGETTFAHLVTNWLRGGLPTEELVAYFRHWRDGMQVEGHGAPRSITAGQGRKAIRDLFGLEPRPKLHNARLFFHEHFRFSHLPSTYAMLDDVDVVVPLRHPLLTAISILRRRGDESGIWEAWSVLDRLAVVPNVIYHRIDAPAAPERLRRRLDLPRDPTFDKAAAAEPVVNRTAADRPADYEAPSKDKNPALLDARRQLVEENALSPILEPFWRHARRSRFLALYEAAGYDFSGY